MVRFRSAAAAASAICLISPSSAALRATIALMPSTAFPTAPISSRRVASVISASISPCAMRCRTDTRRSSGRVMPMMATRIAATRPAPMPSALTIIRLCRVAFV